jgi:hypothetical protein
LSLCSQRRAPRQQVLIEAAHQPSQQKSEVRIDYIELVDWATLQPVEIAIPRHPLRRRRLRRPTRLIDNTIFPVIWLRMRALFSSQLSTATGRRLIWTAVGLSIMGTTLVETPFLLHLAGTSEWQRFSVLSLGFGIVIASAVILFNRRRHIPPTQSCLAGIEAAYLANAALCLVVYAGAPGNIGSRSGWFVMIVIVWPILLELIWIFIRAFGRQAWQVEPRAG